MPVRLVFRRSPLDVPLSCEQPDPSLSALHVTLTHPNGLTNYGELELWGDSELNTPTPKIIRLFFASDGLIEMSCVNSAVISKNSGFSPVKRVV